VLGGRIREARVLENEAAVTVDSLVAEMERLRQQGARFITATGLDERDHFEIIYHFSLDSQVRHLRLRVAKDEAVPSIGASCPGAFLIENEMQELLGVRMTGLAIDYAGKLFMVEGGPEHPLAKQPVEVKPAAVEAGR
jgi:NADH:ubiquinone oxidoreductase subunit C